MATDFFREEERANAAIDAKCSERLLRVHCVNLVFSLHALAARQMPQLRHSQCCRAALKPVIYASCSELRDINDRVVGKVTVRLFI